MRKRSFRNFSYGRCDAFAEYLHRQSLKGWHFKEWRFGLVFEKGEPQDITYAVEVFPKGRENDNRPKEETLEYADYCQAAGWEMVDGKRKWCVFKRKKKDAVLIVTPEERYENIKKADRERSYLFLIWFFFTWIAVRGFWNFWFERNVFQNKDLLLLGIFIVVTFLAVLDAFGYFFRNLQKKSELRKGRVPAYKHELRIHSEYVFVILLLSGIIGLYLCGMGPGKDEITSMFISFLPVVFIFLNRLIGSIVRPKAGKQAVILMIGVLGCYLGVSIYLIVTESQIEGSEEKGDSVQDFPLYLEDVKQTEGIANGFQMVDKSIFGQRTEVWITYDTEKNRELAEQAMEQGNETVRHGDGLNYTIYDCKYEWVADRIWDLQEHPASDEKGCAEWWQAEEAWELEEEEPFCGQYSYFVKYPRTVLKLTSEKSLDEQQIRVICDKLDLL